jgi:hypothetical protein
MDYVPAMYMNTRSLKKLNLKGFYMFMHYTIGLLVYTCFKKTKSFINIFNPESPVCARVWPDLAKILARFWPGLARSGQILARSGQILARSGQILARLWPEKFFKFFF